MTETGDMLILAALAVVVLLQVVLLLRRPIDATAQLRSELMAKLDTIDQTAQAAARGTVKNEGVLDGMTRHISLFGETSSSNAESLRRAVEDRLTQSLTESRNGREELSKTFLSFEDKLERRIGSLEEGLERKVANLGEASAASAHTLREVMDVKLTQSLQEARGGREELSKVLDGFGEKLEQRLSGMDTSLTQRFEGLQNSVGSRLEESGKIVLVHMGQAKSDAATNRKELGETLGSFRQEVTQALSSLAQESAKSRDAMINSAAASQKLIQERFDGLAHTTRGTLDSLKSDVSTQLTSMSGALKDQLGVTGGQLTNQFSTLQESVSQQLSNLVQGTQQSSEQLRVALNERLAAIQTDNTNKLEEMRRTVDEKLQTTLEQRLGESFNLVSERLEQVHKGLGEMTALATNVGDLKKVMTNVKSRGTWGEIQLGAIIDNVLTVDQYVRNVKTVPGSTELVEFAVKLPGRNGEQPCLLPIDSKFGLETYQKLADAQDTGDKLTIQQAGNAFETALKAEAKKISEKYVAPPHTTDFSIMYLPSEAIFAEALRRPGLVDSLQTNCRVVLSGPSNMAALLNSLQMGFRTLAIEKRTSEIANTLGAVKTEFNKFEQIVDATKKSIEAAAKKFDDVGVRTRAIQRKLRGVEELPAPQAAAMLDMQSLIQEEESAGA